jgi:hypothetical protein
MRKTMISMTTTTKRNVNKSKHKREMMKTTKITTKKMMGNCNQEKGGGKP